MAWVGAGWDAVGRARELLRRVDRHELRGPVARAVRAGGHRPGGGVPGRAGRGRGRARARRRDRADRDPAQPAGGAGARDRPVAGDGGRTAGQAGRRRHRRDRRRLRHHPGRGQVPARLPAAEHDHEPDHPGGAGRLLPERGRPPGAGRVLRDRGDRPGPPAPPARGDRPAVRRDPGPPGFRGVRGRHPDRHLPPLLDARRPVRGLLRPVPLRVAVRARPDGPPGRPDPARTLERLGPFAVHQRQHRARFRLGEARVAAAPSPCEPAAVSPANSPEDGAALRQVRWVLERLVQDGTVVARSDGTVHDLFPVAVGAAEGEALRELVVHERATRTIEIGLGYGISALFICEGLLSSGLADTRHLALDPHQAGRFGNCGLQVLEEAGVASLVEHHAEESQIALPRFLGEGRRFDLAFVDGNYRFDGIFLDLVYLGRLLRPGAVVVVDDYQLPAVARAASFCVTNLGWRSEAVSPPDDLHRWAVLRTSAAPDTRPYDHYVAF